MLNQDKNSQPNKKTKKLTRKKKNEPQNLRKRCGPLKLHIVVNTNDKPANQIIEIMKFKRVWCQRNWVSHVIILRTCYESTRTKRVSWSQEQQLPVSKINLKLPSCQLLWQNQAKLKIV